MTACIEPERTLDECSHDRCAEAQWYRAEQLAVRRQEPVEVDPDDSQEVAA